MFSVSSLILALLPAFTCPIEVIRAAGAADAPQAPGALHTDETPPQDPFLDMTPAEALAAIVGTEKVAVVSFYTSWDGESRRMRQLTWAHPEVRSWLKEKTVAVSVDGEAQKELALEWKVTTYPVVVLVRPDGRVVERIKGYRSPENFLALARAAIAGKITGKIPSLQGARALDPMAHLERAGAFYVNTRIEECLDEYLWCLDQADGSDPAFLDRNLDFILKKVISLGRTTARALAALIERRDGLTIQAYAGLLGERRTHHLVRYNFWMRHEYRTLAVFDELANRGQSQDASRRVIFPHVLDLLVGHRRYKDVLDYAGQPMDWIGPLMDQQRALLPAPEPAQDGETPPAPETKESAATTPVEAQGEKGSTTDAALLKDLRQRMALMTGFFYEALLGTGRGKDAEELMETVTAFQTTGRIFNLLIQHALRLEMYDTARKLEQRGLALLPEKGQKLVRRVARKIPKGESPAPPVRSGDDAPAPGSGQDD